MALSENLKQMRLEKGLTQEQLAESVGISRQAISLYEMGIRLPDMITGDRIAETLETTSRELIRGESSRTKQKNLEN